MSAAFKLVPLGGGDFGGRRKASKTSQNRRVTRSAGGDGQATETPGRLKTNQASGVGDFQWPKMNPYLAVSGLGMGVRCTRFSGVFRMFSASQMLNAP